MSLHNLPNLERLETVRLKGSAGEREDGNGNSDREEDRGRVIVRSRVSDEGSDTLEIREIREIRENHSLNLSHSHEGNLMSQNEYKSMSRKDTNLFLLSLTIFAILSISWGGISFTHYQFHRYGDYEEVWSWFSPLFGLSYTNLFLFSFFYTTSLYSTLYYNRFVIGKCIVMTTLALIVLVLGLCIQSVEHDYKDYPEYKRGVLLASIGQFVGIFYYSILLGYYKGEKPLFCGGRVRELESEIE